jgi:hypothetical protein
MLLTSPAHQMLRGLAALAIFGLAYGAATFALRVPEARALAGRITRR